MPRTRVKYCGITRPGDGLTAARLGVDAIGLNFYPKSPRVVDLATARAIAQALPPFVTVVGLFVEPEPHEVARVLQTVALDLLQFHGNEEPAECDRYGHPYLKALAMRAGVDLQAEAQRYAGAKGLLLDTHHKDLYGGSGVSFDWGRIPKDIAKPLILAGGLTPQNVGEAIARVRPFGVDVSGGIESAKGIKDGEKMVAFLEGVNSVDNS